MPEIVSFLHEHYDSSTDVVYAGPDVAYYWHGRFVDSRIVPLSRVIDERTAKVLVTEAGASGGNVEALEHLSPRAEIGDFLVYELGTSNGAVQR